jgi:3-oxoacyl-[acyl-carrier protein] reductase
MPQQNLAGKVAIVTGASRGIGRAIALQLGRAGAAVAVNYAANVALAEEVVAEIQKGGGQALAVQADVGRVPDIQRLFDQAIGQFGRLDILINNAGIIVYRPLIDISEEEYERVMSVNVKGTFFTCQQAARRMAEGGRIINFSTSLTAMMLPLYAAYVASKGAVEQLTRVLARELGPKKITVNVVSPGTTDTELFAQGKTEEQKQSLGRLAALGRLGQPADIADVVAMLVSEEAHWITGQNIRVNGGSI